jgi:hypothetical protein
MTEYKYPTHVIKPQANQQPGEITGKESPRSNTITVACFNSSSCMDQLTGSPREWKLSNMLSE